MAPDNKPQPEFTGDWHTDVGGVGNELQEVRAHFYSKKAQLKLSVEAEASLREKLKKGSGLVDKDRLTNADDFETPITKKWLYGALDTYFKDAVGVDDDGARKNEIFSSLYVIGTKINVDLLQKGWTIEIKKGLLYVKNGDNYVYSDVPLRLDEDAGDDDVRENVVENQTPPRQAAERAGRAKKPVEKQKTTGSPERNMYDEEVDELPETPKTGAQSKEPQKARAPKKHEKNMYDVDSEAAVMGEPGSRIIGKEPRRVSARDSGLFGLPAVGGLADGVNVRKFQGDSGLFPTGERVTPILKTSEQSAKPKDTGSDNPPVIDTYTPVAKAAAGADSPDSAKAKPANTPVQVAVNDTGNPLVTIPPLDPVDAAVLKVEEPPKLPAQAETKQLEQAPDAKESNEKIVDKIKAILFNDYPFLEVTEPGDDKGYYGIDAPVMEKGITIHNKIKIILASPKNGVDKGEIQFSSPLIGGIKSENLPTSKKLKYTSVKEFRDTFHKYIVDQNNNLLAEIFTNKKAVLEAWSADAIAKESQTDPLTSPLDAIHDLTGDPDSDGRQLKIGARGVNGYVFAIDLLTDENGNYTATVSNIKRFNGKTLELSAKDFPSLIRLVAIIINENESEAKKRDPELQIPGMRPLLPSRKHKPPEKWPGTEDKEAKKEHEKTVDEELPQKDDKADEGAPTNQANPPEQVMNKPPINTKEAASGSHEKNETAKERFIRLMAGIQFSLTTKDGDTTGMLHFVDDKNSEITTDVSMNEVSGSPEIEYDIKGFVVGILVEELHESSTNPESAVKAFKSALDERVGMSALDAGIAHVTLPNATFPDVETVRQKHMVRLHGTVPAGEVVAEVAINAFYMPDNSLVAQVVKNGKTTDVVVDYDPKMNYAQQYSHLLKKTGEVVLGDREYTKKKINEELQDTLETKNRLVEIKRVFEALGYTYSDKNIFWHPNKTATITLTREKDPTEIELNTFKDTAHVYTAKLRAPNGTVPIEGRGFQQILESGNWEGKYTFVTNDFATMIRGAKLLVEACKIPEKNDGDGENSSKLEEAKRLGEIGELVGKYARNGEEWFVARVSFSGKNFEAAVRLSKDSKRYQYIIPNGTMDGEVLGDGDINVPSDPYDIRNDIFKCFSKQEALNSTEKTAIEDAAKKAASGENYEITVTQTLGKLHEPPSYEVSVDVKNTDRVFGYNVGTMTMSPPKLIDGFWHSPMKLTIQDHAESPGEQESKYVLSVDANCNREGLANAADAFIKTLVANRKKNEELRETNEKMRIEEEPIKQETEHTGLSIDGLPNQLLKQKIDTPTKKFFADNNLKAELEQKDDGTIEIKIATPEGVAVAKGIQAVFPDPSSSERGVLKFTEPLATGLIAPGIITGENGSNVYRRIKEIKFANNDDMLRKLDDIYIKTAVKLAVDAVTSQTIVENVIASNSEYTNPVTDLNANPPHTTFKYKDMDVKVLLVPQYEKKDTPNTYKYGYKALIYKNGVEITQLWGHALSSVPVSLSPDKPVAYSDKKIPRLVKNTERDVVSSIVLTSSPDLVNLFDKIDNYLKGDVVSSADTNNTRPSIQ